MNKPRKSIRSELAEIRAELTELKNMRTYSQSHAGVWFSIRSAVRLLRIKKRLFATALFCFVGIPLLHAAVPHTFTASTAAVASLAGTRVLRTYRHCRRAANGLSAMGRCLSRGLAMLGQKLA